MLTETEFVEQQRFLGRRIHEHGGVFWEEVHPFYCKPAFVHKSFAPGEAKPARFRSLLGYSHQVNTPEQGNRSVPLMVLDRDELDGFNLQKLPPKKRTSVRRALENCVIQPISDIEANLERMREINASQAVRQEQGAGAETPVCRYTKESDSWRKQMRREFSLRGREWWGAFVDSILVAYLRTYQVDGIRIIQHAKADTAYLKYHPMDALYYMILSKAAVDTACHRIVNGGPLHPSLNYFKEQFLFRTVNYPYYSTHAWLVEKVKKWMSVLRHRSKSKSVNEDGAKKSNNEN
ncbi:MAG: hypothetical protein ACOYJW_04465 [Candidatus Omnitrophota bacterium]|jgi:hypothetical protein